MKLIKNIICLSLLMVAVSTRAQQNSNRIFFRQSMNLVNPAFAGSNSSSVNRNDDKQAHSYSEIGIDFRSQWQGVPGAPETQSFFFSTATGKNVGLGISVINDRTFIESQTALAADFSYHLVIGANHHLYLGVKAGATSYNANIAGLTTYGYESDPSLNNLSRVFNPTVGVGALLKNDHYFVSLSTPNLITSERLEDKDGTARVGQSRLHYYLAAGYDIALGDLSALKAAGIARYTDSAPLSLEFNMLYSFNKRFEIGPTYRLNEAIGGIFIFNVANWVDLGYAYEAASDNYLAAVLNGTHEVFIKLKM